MNILYYIPVIGQEMGGIRQYAVALLKILARDTDNKYFVYHNLDDPEIMGVLHQNPQFNLIKTNPADNKKWTAYLNKITGKISRIYTRISGRHTGKDQLAEICRHNRIDVIHCPFQYLPETKTTKSICTMHDVQELHFPEYFTAEDRADRAVNYLRYIRHADKIIVSYQHIKDDIIKYFKTPPDKINVCLLEMDNLWIDKYDDSMVVPLTYLNITSDFVLYPANTWEHKNHLKLLEAMTILKKQGDDYIKLVCTGHKTAYFDNVLGPYIQDHQLQDQVTFTGVLNEQYLYSMYKTCLGVIVPTLYEAGSFPLMESILLDVPVICSNVTSLPETIGDGQFLFDPNDPVAISVKLKQLWDDKAYRQRSLDNDKKQAPRLRKTDALNNIKAIYSSFKN